jgi:hypothetical protein
VSFIFLPCGVYTLASSAALRAEFPVTVRLKKVHKYIDGYLLCALSQLAKKLYELVPRGSTPFRPGGLVFDFIYGRLQRRSMRTAVFADHVEQFLGPRAEAYRRIFAVDARFATALCLWADAVVMRRSITELTLLSRHQVSAAGLLVAGGSGDDLRGHWSHDAREPWTVTGPATTRL